jgi:hypothetical protein
MKYLMIILGGLACLLVVGCEKVDRANEAVEKAKNLKTEMQKTVDKVKEGMADRTGELTRKATKGSVGSDDSGKDGENDEE